MATDEKLQPVQGSADRVEWFCPPCNTVHPTQAPGRVLQVCPDCKGAMEPSSVNLRRIASLNEELARLRHDLELAQAVNRLSKIGHEAELATSAVVGGHFADLLMDAGYLPRRPDWKHDDPAQAAAWLRGMLKLGANDRAHP